MSDNVINIDYFGTKTPVKKTETYEEFISLLASTFFLNKKMKQNLELIYYDEDNDINTIDKMNYSDSLDEAKEIVLKINSSSESVQEPQLEEIKKNFEKQQESIKEYIDDYEKKLEKICKDSVIKKLEEVDKKHKEELDKIEEFYNNKLNDVKNRTLKQSEKIYNEIQNKSGEIMVNKLEEYNKYIEEEMDKLIKIKEALVNDKINELDFSSLEKKQNIMGEIVENNKEVLEKVIKKE